MISLSHQCVFVHIPKCAGQSVETAFLRELNLTWKDRAVLLLRPKTVSDPKKAPPFLAHLMASQYTDLGYMPGSLFDKYLRFSIIRNPWSRVYSIYKYQTKKKISFSDYVVNVFDKKIFRKMYWFAAPQFEYLSSKSGDILIDNIVRLEDVAEVESIFKSLGFADAQLPHVNESKSKSNKVFHKRYQDAYCEKSYEVVKRIYSQDIKMFDYSF